MGDRGQAAFYREQATVLARRAVAVSDQASRLELLEMAATFQRLALREEVRVIGWPEEAAALTRLMSGKGLGCVKTGLRRPWAHN